MTNKTIMWIVVVALVVVGGIYLMMNTPNTTDTNSEATQQSQKVDAEGRVIFSVTDAAANMGTISEINMKVNSVDMHSSTEGWVTVSTTPKTYSLLMLNAQNKSELLADINAKAGTYDQVRLIVDSVSVKTKAGVTSIAKLPSGELKINTKIVINADETSSVNFDFLADKSLHVTGNGSYIFAPVVKTETRSSGEVSVDSYSVVKINGGTVDDSNTVGMDIDGSVKINFLINAKQKLNVDANNVIKIEGLI